jgi:hypothetical protein
VCLAYLKHLAQHRPGAPAHGYLAIATDPQQHAVSLALNELPATQGAVIRDLNDMFNATAAQNMGRFKIKNAIGFFGASDALDAVSA